MTVKPIPEGHHSITPYLSIRGATEAIDFYQRAFGAVELFRMATPDGNLGHAEIRIGDSLIMLADPCEEGAFQSPHALGGSTVALHLYVEDADALFVQATAAGAKVIEPVEDRFYGDRGGVLEDPYGHVWFLSTHKEDLTLEEIEARARDFFEQASD